MAADPRATPLLRLASASPRRATLLELVRIPFERAPADVEERSGAGEDPARTALGNARLKALASARAARDRPPRWTLGADTLVVLDDRALGKPRDAREARAVLAALSGRTHRVVTGWTLVEAGAVAMEEHSVTRVTFRPLDEARLDDYVRDREWTDKAGGYAIQGRGAHLIERIEGDPFNVMGLPVGRVVEGLLVHRVIARYPLVTHPFG
jgi:septum formation protein